MSDAPRHAARAIRDAMASKEPIACNPTFMDGDGWWKQIREWPTLGLVRFDTGPSEYGSNDEPKTKRSRTWAWHSLT